jgi:hypothetical protein
MLSPLRGLSALLASFPPIVHLCARNGFFFAFFVLSVVYCGFPLLSRRSECRISPASAMIGMTETTDGRVLIAMHEGYRVPGYIRGQFFRVTPEGPVPAE